MTDIVIVAIVLLIVSLASWYVYRAKKRGKTCVGCPGGCSCSCDASCSTCQSHGNCKN